MGLRGVCLAAVMCLCTQAHGDPTGQVPVRRFGAESGLGNLAVNHIAQSADGMMWIGTEDGLYRYDGETFDRFGHRDGLPSDEIYTLLAAPHALWIGTLTGLARFDRDGITAFGAAQGAPTTNINAMALAPDGSLWVASNSGLYHQTDDAFAVATGWPGGQSSAVWVDDRHVIASSGSALLSRDASGTWTRHGAELGLGRERIDAIARTSDGLLWVRTARYLARCDVDLHACEDASNELPGSGEFGRLFVDAHGTLWVPTTHGLAHRLASGAWVRLSTDEGLPTPSVITAFVDREGSLWYAADELYEVLGRDLWRTFTAPDTLPTDSIWGILRDRGGGLWASSNRGVLDGTGERWTVFPGTESFAILSVIEGEPGALYAAGRASEVMRIDRATKAVRVIASPTELGGAGVNSMIYERGTLWVAQTNGGLGRIDDVAGAARWQREPLPGGSDDEDVQQLVLDHDGRLWATGQLGLVVRVGGQWRRFTTRDGLRSNQVAYATTRANGELCVAYEEAFGVTCFKYDGGLAQLHHLDRATGLTSDKVYVLGEDRFGRLYVGSSIGVDVVTDAGVEHFSSASGLAWDDCSARAFWADAQGAGDVMIGSSRGISRFAAARYAPATPVAAPVILSLALGGRVTPAGQVPAAPAPGHTSLTVSFATPSFVDRSQLQQQIRLVPLDDEWRTTTLRESRYAELPPGDYVFEIRARVAHGEFGPTTRIAFRVAPAWWQVLWVRALGGALTFLAVVLVIAWRSRIMNRRAARQIVARSEASFRTLIERSPDAVLVHRHGELIYVNHRAATQLGYDEPEELLGKTVASLIHPDEKGGSLLDPDTLHELRMLRRDGSGVAVEVSTMSVDFAGEPAVVALARDITERKTLEGRLLMTERMASIGTLAAGVAHEVNNPLAYVKANLGQLADELDAEPPGSTSRVALADALEGVQRVQKIVSDLKIFSRTRGDQRAPIDLLTAIELALRMTNTELRHRGKVVSDLRPVPYVLGDDSRLGQVFLNLLINAAQALPVGRIDRNEIRVSSRTDERGWAIVEIGDNGVGMTPAVRQRVFEPFFTTKDVGEGTGLGLSICLGIVQEMGGQIEVESTVGVGTTFRLTLPPTAAAPKPAAPKVETTPASTRIRLLVIDDDDRLRATLGRMLAKDHEVTLCESAVAALALLETDCPFDAILSDLMMPDMTGMELYARLKERSPAIADRVIFVTGGAFTEEAKHFLEVMVDRWIEKPFESAEIRRLIRSVVHQSEPPAQAQ